MKRNLATILIASILLIFCVSLLSAQEKEQFRQQRRERELKETIKVYMYFKMKGALDLTQEQEEGIIPKVEEMEMTRHRFIEERQGLLQGLGSLLDDPKTSDEAIIRELGLFKKLEENHRKEEDSIISQINEILTPRQRAKFLIFMVDFRRELQDKIDNVRRMQENDQMRRRRALEPNPPGGDDGY